MGRQPGSEASTVPVTTAYAQVAVLATDAAGRIVSCTNSLKDLGLTVERDPVGKFWDALFGAASETQVDAESGLQWSFFAAADDPGQGYRVARYPMLTDDSSPPGFFYIVERIAPEDANDRMLHYEKMFSLGETAASVAHEVNNPLSVISGWLQLSLMQMPADWAHRELFEKMQREANRIAQVATNLLNFARRHPPQTSMVDVNEVVSELVNFIDYQFRNDNISIITALAADLPFVETDRNRLKQVLWNLVINARQAMANGGELTLSTKSGDMIQVRVEDTGVGIPPEVEGRIFEPFFTTKQDSGGTGLGLSVSRTIISALGGSLDVQSEVGVGTTFIIQLPITKPAHNGNA